MFLSERKEIDKQIQELHKQRAVWANADRTLCEHGLEGMGCDQMHYQNAHFYYEFSPIYIRNILQSYDQNFMGNFIDAKGQVEVKKILYRA